MLVGRSGVARPRARRKAPDRSARPPVATREVRRGADQFRVAGEGHQHSGDRPGLDHRHLIRLRQITDQTEGPSLGGLEPVGHRHRSRGIDHEHRVGSQQSLLGVERAGQRENETGQDQQLQDEERGDPAASARAPPRRPEPPPVPRASCWRPRDAAGGSEACRGRSAARPGRPARTRPGSRNSCGDRGRCETRYAVRPRHRRASALARAPRTCSAASSTGGHEHVVESRSSGPAGGLLGEPLEGRPVAAHRLFRGGDRDLGTGFGVGQPEVTGQLRIEFLLAEDVQYHSPGSHPEAIDGALPIRSHQVGEQDDGSPVGSLAGQPPHGRSERHRPFGGQGFEP